MASSLSSLWELMTNLTLATRFKCNYIWSKYCSQERNKHFLRMSRAKGYRSKSLKTRLSEHCHRKTSWARHSKMSFSNNQWTPPTTVLTTDNSADWTSRIKAGTFMLHSINKHSSLPASRTKFWLHWHTMLCRFSAEAWTRAPTSTTGSLM